MGDTRVVNATPGFLSLSQPGGIPVATVPPLDAGDVVTVDLQSGASLEGRSLLDGIVVASGTATGHDSLTLQPQPVQRTDVAKLPMPVALVSPPPVTLDVTGQEPDPARRPYVTITEVPVYADPGDLVFNTVVAPKRRSVTITGVALVWDGNHGDIEAFSGDDVLDVAELTLIADTITVGKPLRFPGANVTVKARVLDFKNDGRIDTTSLAWSAPAVSPYPWTNTPDPAKPDSEDHNVYPGRKVDATVVRADTGADGADGGRAGNITLEIRELRLPAGDKVAKRLVAHGAPGQAAEPGGICPRDPDEVTLAKISRDDLARAFKAQFALSKNLQDWFWPDDWLKLFPVDGASSVVHANIAAIDQRITSMTTDFMGFPGGERIHALVVRGEGNAFVQRKSQISPPPKIPAAPAAYPGGLPGDGGAGGTVRCTLQVQNFASLCDVGGGEAGPETSEVKGGESRVKSPAHSVYMVVNRTSNAINYERPQMSVVDLAPAPGKNALGRTGAGGTDGTVENGTLAAMPTGDGSRTAAPVGNAASWLDPAALDAVLRCAVDTFRSGRRQKAWTLLEPYHAECQTAVDGALAAHAVQIDLLKQRLVANLDYAGHPPGYVPRLSAIAAFRANQTTRAVSMRMIAYASQAIEAYKTLDAQKDEIARAREAMTRQLDVSRTRVAGAAGKIGDASTDLEKVIESVQSKQGQIDLIVDQLTAEVKDDLERQKIYSGVMHLLGGALEAIPVFQPYLGLAGSAINTLGEIDLNKPAGPQIGDTLGKLGTKVNDFIVKNRDLITADATHDPSIASNQDKVDSLAQKLRDHEDSLATADKASVAANVKVTTAKAAVDTAAGELKAAQITAANTQATWRAELGKTKDELNKQQEALKRAEENRFSAQTQDAEKEYQDALAAADKAKKVVKTKLAARVDFENDARDADTKRDTATDKVGALQREKVNAAATLEIGRRDQELKRKQVAQTCDRLAKIGTGLSDIGVGIATLSKPVSPTDPAIQQMIAERLASGDEVAKAYADLKQDWGGLVAAQRAAVAKLVRAQADLTEGIGDIASALNKLLSLREKLQSDSGLADARTFQHLVELRERGRDMARGSLDLFIAALRYDLAIGLAPDALDVDDVATDVAGTQAATADTKATDDAIATAADKELWVRMSSIASERINQSGGLAETAGQTAAKVVIGRPDATPGSERERTNLRILDELSSSVRGSRVRCVEDLHVVSDYKLRHARIKNIKLTGLEIDAAPREGFFIDVEIHHGGEQLMYERDDTQSSGVYYFFQSGADDPRSWNARVTWSRDKDGNLSPAVAPQIAADDPTTERLLDLMLANKTAPPADNVKLTPYDPGLYAWLTINVFPDVAADEQMPKINRLTFDVTYTSLDVSRA
jgi:hypothetical protein